VHYNQEGSELQAECVMAVCSNITKFGVYAFNVVLSYTST